MIKSILKIGLSFFVLIAAVSYIFPDELATILELATAVMIVNSLP